MKEIAYSWRVLRRAPGPTGLSVVTIGIGIVVSTVLFALIDGVVLRPLPYPTADRLVTIVDTNPALGVDRTGAAHASNPAITKAAVWCRTRGPVRSTRARI
jgi:hypothetical protein